jgi:uncharacterized membrane protein YGL010W
MKNFVEHLSNYAQYHRDSRNILTHLVGVPVIVFAVIVLLSRPSFEVGGMSLTLAIIGYIAATLFYLRLNITFGLLMATMMAAGIYAANIIATASTVVWLSTGIGLFIGGWIVQFIGHHYEGKKPAFVDDLVGLLIGPLFVTAEILFALGLFKSLKKDIEQRAGVVRNGSQERASI